MARAQDIRKMAAGLEKALTEIRRDLHQHPETAFNETRTAGKVAAILGELGLKVTPKVGKTGVVGLLRGGKSRRTVALRADMDALPVEEANRVPYCSRNKGVMHACGHDGHTTMLLGAAMLLTELKSRIRGNVKFLFQPAEETISGAPAMIRDGALDAPKVQAIVGVHLTPDLPMGKVGLRAGPMMASANHFRITLTGSGGHGAAPHKTRDPLVAANAIYEACTTIRRNIDAFEPFVLSVCSIQAGTIYNIIPQDAVLLGTLRVFSKEMFAQIRTRLRKVLRGVALTHGIKCRLSFDVSSPVVVNDAKVIELVRGAAKDIGLATGEAEMSMGGEDFAYFLERVPGAFVRLGTSKARNEPVLHSNRFDFDEAVLPLGSALMAQYALRYLRGK